MSWSRTSPTIRAGSAPPTSRFDVIACSSTPAVGPRSWSGRMRGSTDTASRAQATSAVAAASHRRVISAIRVGISVAGTVYGVNANNCTRGPRSHPPSRSTAHARPGSTSSQTSTVPAMRRAGWIAGAVLVVVMAARLSARGHPHGGLPVRVEVLRRHQEPGRRADVLALEVTERESGVECAGGSHDAGARGQRRAGPGAALAGIGQPSAGRVGRPAHGLARADQLLRSYRLVQQPAGPRPVL